MDFTHLHVHSHYSLMDGLCSPEELMLAAKNAGQSSMAITDHGTLASHRDLQVAAKKLGMKPILGLEAYISATDRFDKRDIKSRDDNTQVFNHITLLAKNNEGLKNLQKLSEIAWTEGYYRKPRIDLEILDEYGNDLIVLSGCMNGLIAKAIQNNNMEKAMEYARWFKNRFADDFYLEVQSHNDKNVNDATKEISLNLNIKMVAAGDCHYATKSQKSLEEALLILSTKPAQADGTSYESGKKYKDVFERFNHLYPNRPISFQDINVYIQSYDEIKSDFGVDWPESIYTNTNEIANKAYRAWSAYRQQLDKAAPNGKADPATVEKQLMAFVSKNLLAGQYLPSLINKDQIIGLVLLLITTKIFGLFLNFPIFASNAFLPSKKTTSSPRSLTNLFTC